VNLGESAALRALKRAAPPKCKIALQKKDFPRFQLAMRDAPKDVAPLVTLARSAPGIYGGAHRAS
jgi:hypothetical protein